MDRKARYVISHWHSMSDDFSTSAMDFYEAVEEALKARNLPEDVKTERMTFNEGGVLSAGREYLRVKRENIAFDICAAPYGNSYFFSWWLAKVPGSQLLFWLALGGLLFGYLVMVAMTWRSGCFIPIVLSLLIPIALLLAGNAVRDGNLGDEDEVLEIPIFGKLYEIFFNPVTYYRLDSAIMFQESVSRAVNEVIQGLRSEQGLRALTPEELKPTSNLFGR